MQLGEPDESGRRRPEVIPGSEFVQEVDVVVLAIGYSPDDLMEKTTPGLRTTNWKTVRVDEDYADDAPGRLRRRRQRQRRGPRRDRDGGRPPRGGGHRQLPVAHKRAIGPNKKRNRRNRLFLDC